MNDLTRKILCRGVPPLAVIGLALYFNFYVGSNAKKLYDEKNRIEQVDENEGDIPQPNFEDAPMLPDKPKSLPEGAGITQKNDADSKSSFDMEKLQKTFGEVFPGEQWQSRALPAWMNKFVQFVDEIANGNIPLKSCGELRVEEQFSAEKQNGAWRISQACVARYSQYVDYACNIDVPSAVKLYKEAIPALNSMLEAIGYADANIDALLLEALDTLCAVPVLEEEPALVRLDETHYAYQDEQLEKLCPACKLCLRMGYVNAAKIHNKAVEIKTALQSARD